MRPLLEEKDCESFCDRRQGLGSNVIHRAEGKSGRALRKTMLRPILQYLTSIEDCDLTCKVFLYAVPRAAAAELCDPVLNHFIGAFVLS